jgi:hypothetical protein
VCLIETTQTCQAFRIDLTKPRHIGAGPLSPVGTRAPHSTVAIHATRRQCPELRGRRLVFHQLQRSVTATGLCQGSASKPNGPFWEQFC